MVHLTDQMFNSVFCVISISSACFPDKDADAQAVLKEASSQLQEAFNFHTTTIQIENYSEDMNDCQECQSPLD